MAKVLMTVELEYDADVVHGDDEESIAWFFDEILSEEKGLLLLHSNEIGDTVGKIRVLSAAPHKYDWELKQALLHFDHAANPATVKRMAELLVMCRDALRTMDEYCREYYAHEFQIMLIDSGKALAALDAFEKEDV